MNLKSLFVVIALFAGCNKTNPNYCPGNPDNNCNENGDGGPDATASCAVHACASGVCDPASETCVQCTAAQPAACTMTTPVCGTDDTCHACTSHAQCTSSNVCMPSGACGDVTQIAYVSASGAGTTCTHEAPCPLLSDAVAKNQPTIKIASDGASNESATVTISGKTVTILADKNAKLGRATAGAVLTITDANTNVSIYDLEISGALGTTGDAIDVLAAGTPSLSLVRVKLDGNGGLGLSTTSAGVVSVAQSIITANNGGGLSIAGTGTVFTVINNFITYNGIATGQNASQIGGAAIVPNTAGSKFVFNTVAYNNSDGTYSGGVSCLGALTVAASNVAYHNTEGGMMDDTTQVAGNCQFGNTVALGSVVGDMGFVSPTSGTYDFHLTPNTPPTVLDAAGQCTGIDIDGQARPWGAACDLGADEYMP